MIRVLIVDDDYRVAELHARYVSAVSGFEVASTARSGRQAAELDERLRPDLILLDQYLPDQLGSILQLELRGDVIMVTAAAEAAQVRLALSRGAVGYLMKPFEPEALTRRLESYARYHKQLHGRRNLTQEQIDRALLALCGADRRGSGSQGTRRSPTAELIAAALCKAEGSATASELAVRLGLSRTTVQRYLAGLSASGEVSVELQYGTAGRPEHRYRWTTPNP